MARKNMFAGLTPEGGQSEGPAGGPEVFQQTGPIAAIRNDLRNVSARSVQEIDPSLVEDTGLRDRLGDIESDLGALRDSIAAHGQQVPVLLRPHPRMSGRYQVVYGRRRLAAIRGLGLPVKALIRSLSDEEAVLAQGQENNLRKDPSFVEKALFAGDLEAAGYEPRVIQDALNVSRSHTSHMRKVREAFPREVIERIGAAPSVGWKRWYESAMLLLEHGVDPRAVHPGPFPREAGSDERFGLWIAALGRRIARSAPAGGAPAPSAAVTAPDGRTLGAVSRKGAAVTFRASPPETPFADWLAANAQAAFGELYDKFLAQTRDQG